MMSMTSFFNSTLYCVARTAFTTSTHYFNTLIGKNTKCVVITPCVNIITPYVFTL